MEVAEVSSNEVVCTVVDGGVLYDRSGMSLPGTRNAFLSFCVILI